MKSKWIIYISLCIAVIFIALAIFISYAKELIPEINQVFVNEKVETFLSTKSKGPLKVGKNKIAEYEIQELQVLLLDEGISIQTHVIAKSNGYTIEANMTIFGKPTYRDRGFYFTPYEDREPEFSKFKTSGKFKSDGILGNVITKFEIPKTWNKVIKKTFKNIFEDDELMKPIISKTISKGLKTFPIYKLKNTALQNTVAMSLDSFEIKDKVLHITISFWQFAWHIFLFLILGGIFLLIAVAFIRNPGIMLLGAAL